jgi:CMP-N,N'-diacetyllegionaminic acid synthase
MKNKKFNKVILIPARSGSKRLKDKNIMKIKNKTLLYFTIKQALKIKNIDHVIVSTDSLKYAKIAQDCGAKILYIRPKKISRDTSSDFEVFSYNEKWLNNNLDYHTDIYIHLRPTFPIREILHINKMIKTLEEKFKEIDSIRSVIKTNLKLEKYYKINSSGLLKNNYSFIKPKKNNDFAGNHSDQVVGNWYKHNGNIDVFKASLLKKNTISGKKILSFKQKPIFDYDVNTIDDFKKIKKILISKYF